VRVHDIKDEQGRVQAFEVATFFLDRGALRTIVEAIPGATVVAYRPYKERLCEFKVGGVAFLVHEAFGESERYWVGPVEAGWSPHLAVIRETFARARPFLWFVRF
jgi:hypothetical protein